MQCAGAGEDEVKGEIRDPKTEEVLRNFQSETPWGLYFAKEIFRPDLGMEVAKKLKQAECLPPELILHWGDSVWVWSSR